MFCLNHQPIYDLIHLGPVYQRPRNDGWGSYAWFASEPDCLVVFSDSPLQIKGN
jgi:hypothetical protein